MRRTISSRATGVRGGPGVSTRHERCCQERIWPSTGARHASRLAGVVVAFSVCASWVTGCAVSGFVADFELYSIRTIAVSSVENATPHDLEAVDLSSFLQARVFGSSSLNVLATLRGALEETLTLKGYDVSGLNASGQGAEAASHPGGGAGVTAPDAVVEARVNSFQLAPGLSAQLRMYYTVQAHDTASGNLLFSREGWCEHRGDSGLRAGPTPAMVLRRSAREALDGWPERGVK